MGEDISAWIAAIQSGEVDYLDLGDENPLDAYLTLRENPEINVVPVPTAQCRVLRMRADLEPWSDNRVRQALKLCQNREKLINLSQFGEAFTGHDAHVCPVHPEYCEKPIQDYDPEKAKQLLADAGYPDGLDVEIGINAGVTDFVTMAEILKEDAAPAGFNISISTMPASQYWEQWTELSLGITPWTHRPLGTMVLNLAYTVDQNGDPVPWNETRWVDEEFIDLLHEANGTLDVEKRRELFCELEQIQMDRGSIGIAFWRNIWFMARDSVKNMEGHPTYYMLFNEVWKEA
jgi:peptide/nickel transport system substrate-binding protein